MSNLDTRTESDPTTRTDRPWTTGAAVSNRITAVLAALLSLAVVVIHIEDQGGLPGDKSPGYVGVGYWLLELAGVVAAIWLVGRASRGAWLLSLGVALGPLVGYVLSRGPGLPAYHDDRGNWGEPLGVISLVVEGALALLALGVLTRGRGRTGESVHARPSRREPLTD
jgi:hypothetical protein